jgi:hypothetical protein
VDWCENNTMKWLKGDEILSPEPKTIKIDFTNQHKYDDNKPHCMPSNLKNIVAVSFRDENDRPSFWLGKCLRVNQEELTLLLEWFQ